MYIDYMDEVKDTNEEDISKEDTNEEFPNEVDTEEEDYLRRRKLSCLFGLCLYKFNNTQDLKVLIHIRINNYITICL